MKPPCLALSPIHSKFLLDQRLKIKRTASFLDGYTFNRMRVNHGGSDS